MIQATGYAAKHSFSRLKPLTIEREEPKINEAYKKVKSGEVRLRYVIDAASLS